VTDAASGNSNAPSRLPEPLGSRKSSVFSGYGFSPGRMSEAVEGYWQPVLSCRYRAAPTAGCM